MGKYIKDSTMMASEFYVLSQLWMRGIPATLTLGNRKSIDILIEIDDCIKTIDVKGIRKRGKGDKWPIGSKSWENKKDHFLVLLRWDKDQNKLPEVWVVPAPKVEKLKKEWLPPNFAIYYESDDQENNLVMNDKKASDRYLSYYKNQWQLLERISGR